MNHEVGFNSKRCTQKCCMSTLGRVQSLPEVSGQGQIEEEGFTKDENCVVHEACIQPKMFSGRFEKIPWISNCMTAL